MVMMSVGSFNPEKEVRKLQELVKKLEQQNEILRTQQFDEKVETPPAQNEQLPPPPPPQQTSDSSDEIMECDPTMTEEESWLFTPSKKPTPQQMNQTAVEWMREHFDNPASGLSSSKRLLLHKLEEFKLINNSKSNDVSSEENSIREPPEKEVRQIPHVKQPALKDLSSRIDSGTFARTRKVDRISKSVSPFSPRLEEQSKLQPQLLDREEPLNDLTDVRVIARLQEESLKQQVHNLHNLTHRSRTGSQASMNSSNGSLDEIPGESPTSMHDKYKTFTRRKQMPAKTPSPTSNLSNLSYSHSRGNGQSLLMKPSIAENDRQLHSKSYDGGSPLRLKSNLPSAKRQPNTGIPRPSMLPRPGRPK